MKELLLTLQIIHNNNYAHLDLKPENISDRDATIFKLIDLS